MDATKEQIRKNLKKYLIFKIMYAIISKLSQTADENWGISSAGRALHWQCRGQRFDPAMLHHKEKSESLSKWIKIRIFCC